MDNERLNELISKIKGNEAATPENVNDFINKNLTANQAAVVNKVLQDPELISRLLSSEQAKQLLNRLTDKGE